MGVVDCCLEESLIFLNPTGVGKTSDLAVGDFRGEDGCSRELPTLVFKPPTFCFPAGVGGGVATGIILGSFMLTL